MHMKSELAHKILLSFQQYWVTYIILIIGNCHLIDGLQGLNVNQGQAFTNRNFLSNFPTNYLSIHLSHHFPFSQHLMIDSHSFFVGSDAEKQKYKNLHQLSW